MNKSPLIPALTGALLLGACAQTGSVIRSVLPFGNPFFHESPLPYGLPPFDQIENDHFLPAFERGMADQLREVEDIATNPEPPTFENTIVALERSGKIYQRVNNVFSNLSSAHTNEVIKEVEKIISPKRSAHVDAIYLNSTLFSRIKVLHENRHRIDVDAEAMRLIEEYHQDFVRRGADLREKDKQQLRAWNEEIASLTTQFRQNLQEDTNDLAVVVDNRAELDGLSEEAIGAAAEAAKARGLEGKFLLNLVLPTPQPALSSLTNRALRERIHRATVSRGNRGNDFDNKAVIAKLVHLRAQRARLLGQPNHAADVLADETAGHTTAVNELLQALAPAAVANARREAADLQAMVRKSGESFRLQAWDWQYYTEQLRKARYDFDEAEMRPYFELNRVLEDGIFFMAQALYGLTFTERPDLPAYHADVRVFEVFNEDGSGLGLFLFDPYARDSKRGGAWMNNYTTQSRLTSARPVVGNHLNIPKPAPGQPALLTYDEVNTAFHEFGHAVHGLFSDVGYPYFAGTSVPRDFVEFPSQVHEMWMLWPEVLANYARHHETGAPMPKALVDKLQASKKFNQGFKTVEYLAASLLDQAWHQLDARAAARINAKGVEAFEAEALKRAGIAMDEIPPRYRSSYFAHVFAGGYSAGYYSYIWSEVLDADTVKWFEEQGGLSRINGEWFRRKLLAAGGSVEATELFRRFRGRDPDLQPLLERRGLEATGAAPKKKKKRTSA